MCFNGKPAPALPIRGYCEIHKLQCPRLDSKPCTPSNKKSPAFDLSHWAITCKPTKSNPCHPRLESSSNCSEEKKRIACTLNPRSSSVITATNFDDSYPRKSRLSSQSEFFFQLDPSLDLSKRGFRNNVIQDLSSQYFDEKGPCSPPKRCPSRIDKRRGSSCPPSSECPKPSCPPPTDCPKPSCPPASESPKSRCPPPKKCPSHGDKGDGGSGPPKICAPNVGGSCAPPPHISKKSYSNKKFPPKCTDKKKIEPPKTHRVPVCPPRKKPKKCIKRPVQKKVKCGPRQTGMLLNQRPKLKKTQCVPLIKGTIYHSRVCPGKKVVGCANPVQAPPQPRCPAKTRQEQKKRDAPPCPPRIKEMPKKK